ncbi:MAG TPA: hypothetical protein VFL99_15155 [Segeticoccus sp.]|uniref:hypothetical protein n=1 Tax=Segeticoccus sp. TaxID=2706531 RepID=UPI002D80F0B5|nr:hypothetical protein [Segeticoccus sp.]HET8601664.1 hypothetical protein [Segeticoccus sp.]
MSTSTSDDTGRDLERLSPLARITSIITAAQALVLLGFVVFYLLELGAGASDSPARVVTSAILILVFAVALGVLAKYLWQRARQARTPALVWNVLMLPVGWTLAQSGRADIGWPVIGVAVVAVVTVILASRPEHPRS